MAGMMHDETPLAQGLSQAEVRARTEAGQDNRVRQKTGATLGQILRENLFTLFNLLNVVLAALVLSVGSYRNALFMGVVLFNTAIGLLQAIRAKRAVEKLSLLNAPTATVRRDGAPLEIAVGDVVLGDLLILSTGMQVPADALLREGALEADESLLTGESVPVAKQAGDALLSGSFVVSGHAVAQAMAVGDAAYAAKIAQEAKKPGQNTSELMASLNRIIRFVSLVIVPLGILLFCKQFFLSGEPYRASIIATVAAMIGMIPEGLMLLTSVALAVGVVRLARRDTLTQSLYSLETLARVDVLCLDKTGTLTTGGIAFEGMEPINGTTDEAKRALRRLLYAVGTENATTQAIERAIGSEPCQAGQVLPFSSARKCSAAEIDRAVYALGATEFVLPKAAAALRPRLAPFAARGLRVLVLAKADGGLGPDQSLPADMTPLAFVLLTDVLRADAPDTLRYFAQQGVSLKVISGDDPQTAAAIAGRAGLPNAERYVDLSALPSDDAVADAALRYTVFGRVTPERKRTLVCALRAQGHVVAMTGDGVNDVPALKAADCSVAMGTGSDAARQVAQIVLLDADFSAMPRVVCEGRRVINNIRRSASLFLTKTGFSFLAALVTLLFGEAYPLQPIHLTLFSTVAIGVPSFLLALQPNDARVEGAFLPYVIRKALPGAFTLAVGVLILAGAEPNGARETLATYYMIGVGLFNLLLVCQPLNAVRAGIWGLCALIALLAALFLPNLFLFVPLVPAQWLRLGLTVVGSVPCILGLSWLIDQISSKCGVRQRLQS